MSKVNKNLLESLQSVFTSGRLIKRPNESEQRIFHKLINELTKQEIILLNDPTFLNQSERVKELTTTRLVDINKDTVVFRTKSSNFGETGREYTQRIRLVDLYDLIDEYKNGKIRYSDAFQLAINSGDIEIYCSCPAFLYWGFQYINTDLDSIVPGREMDIEPEVRNPKLKGMYCKHMQLALDVLPFNAARLMRKWRVKYV